MPVKSLFDRSARTRSGLFSESLSKRLYRHGSRRSAPFDRSGAFQRRPHCFAKFCVRYFRNAVSGDYDDIDAAAHQRDERRNSLTHAPLDTVSAYAVSLFFADGNADPRLSRPTVCNDNDHEPVRGGFADTIGVAKFFFLFECIFAFHRITRPEKVCAKPSAFVRLKKRAASRCLPQAPVCLNCTQKKTRLCAQLFAALCASALQNVATVCGLHALTKAMHLAALPFLRLIGTYHPLHLTFDLSWGGQPTHIAQR